MSARNPKPTGTGGKKDPPKKQQQPQPEKPQPSTSKKTPTDKGNTSRSGGSLVPSSPLNPKPSPTSKKPASPMLAKKEADKSVMRQKSSNLTQKPPQADEFVKPLDPEPASGSRLQDPPSRRMKPVETGQFTKRVATEVRPVAVRPDLSPRSKRVHEAACNFLAVKKQESSEQKAMETFVMQMFPKLQYNLKRVQELSHKVGVLPVQPPLSDEDIKKENDSLNRHIATASYLFKEFEKELNSTRAKVVEFMAKAENGTRNLDITLKDAIQSIANYAQAEGEKSIDISDDDDEPGDDKDGKPPGAEKKDHRGEDGSDDGNAGNLSPPTSDSEPDSDDSIEDEEKFRKKMVAVLNPMAALSSYDAESKLHEEIPKVFAATISPLKELLKSTNSIFDPMVECLSDPSIKDSTDQIAVLKSLLEGAKRTVEPLKAMIDESEGAKGSTGDVDDVKKVVEQLEIPEEEKSEETPVDNQQTSVVTSGENVPESEQ